MDWKNLLLSFQGRINRKPFWLGLIVAMIVTSIPYGLASTFFMTWAEGPEPGTYVATETSPIAWLLIGLSVIASIWIGLALQVKRWHDRDKSGWWTLASLVPILNIWAFISTGFLKGTEGPNRFGPDPLAG